MRDRILLAQRFVTRQVGLRLREQRRVLGQLPLGLGERGLIGPRVDLGEKIAGLDDLSFLEADLHQPAGDLRLDRHGGERRRRAERVDGDRHVAGDDRRHADGLGGGDRRRPRPAPASGRRSARRPCSGARPNAAAAASRRKTASLTQRRFFFAGAAGGLAETGAIASTFSGSTVSFIVLSRARSAALRTDARKHQFTL